MALINRMSRLFTADVHAVLDRIEEPDVLLKQAIREMEEEVAASEQRARQLEHERDRLADRQRKVQAALAELDEQIGVAFGAGNDELARKLVKRKLETARLDAHVTERRAAAAKALAERAAALTEQRERLDVLRQKAELLAEAPHADPGDEWGKTGFSVGDDEVEVAFLRERQKRTRP
ncbi:MAG TPA: PspA/IM30 family protein [Gammaproteobacteria bacterium]|nr:PspA/IM30 family protein [Gammaproteobacteria bacterium]